MSTSKKIMIVILILLNAVVLLGQLKPEDAPPFARTVNIVFLICSLLFFIASIIKPKKNNPA
jgi:hypothetical protein